MAASHDLDPARRWRFWRRLAWGTAAFLLLLPAVAMQFTSEVDWTASDFVVMGAIFAACCGAFDLATRVAPNFAYVAATGLAIGTAFLLVWINLAVGIIHSENNVENLMFAGVIAVAVVGAAYAGTRPERLARAMYAAAITEALVAVVVAAIGPRDEALVLSVFFILPWIMAAALYGHAARNPMEGVARRA